MHALLAAPSINPFPLSHTALSTSRAVANAMRNGKKLLMNKGYSEDEAITIMSVAGDFGITQVGRPE
jgi:acetamidase/formamidase